MPPRRRGAKAASGVGRPGVNSQNPLSRYDDTPVQVGAEMFLQLGMAEEEAEAFADFDPGIQGEIIFQQMQHRDVEFGKPEAAAQRAQYTARVAAATEAERTELVLGTLRTTRVRNHFKAQLEAGVSPNLRVADEEFGGRKATLPILCLAARYGWVEGVEVLLAAGADAKAFCTTTGGTALHNAATQSEPQFLRCATLLIEAGCPLDALMSMEVPRSSPSYKLQSPALHMAVIEGDPRMVKLLLDAGANVDAANRRGETALIIAAFIGAEEVKAVLLAAGADKTLKDAEGHTAAQVEAGAGFGRR